MFCSWLEQKMVLVVEVVIDMCLLSCCCCCYDGCDASDDNDSFKFGCLPLYISISYRIGL